MKELIASLIAKIRAAIAKLPLGEQIEANQTTGWALQRLAEIGVTLDVQFPGLQGIAGDEVASNAEVLKALDKWVATETKTLMDAAEAKGEIFTKAAFDTGVATAAQAAETKALEKFQKQAADNAEAGLNRAKIVEAGIKPAAAALVPDAALVGANAEATIRKVTARFTELSKFISPETSEGLFTSCCEALDDAGDAAFKRVLDTAAATKAGVEKKPAAVEAHAEARTVPGNPAEAAAAAADKPKFLPLA